MFNIIWILWALKIAGVTTLTYNTLGWITVIVFCLACVDNALKDYVAQKQLEKIVDCAKDDEKTVIMAVLMAMFKKMK